MIVLSIDLFLFQQIIIINVVFDQILWFRLHIERDMSQFSINFKLYLTLKSHRSPYHGWHSHALHRTWFTGNEFIRMASRHNPSILSFVQHIENKSEATSDDGLYNEAVIKTQMHITKVWLNEKCSISVIRIETALFFPLLVHFHRCNYVQNFIRFISIGNFPWNVKNEKRKKAEKIQRHSDVMRCCADTQRRKCQILAFELLILINFMILRFFYSFGIEMNSLCGNQRVLANFNQS